jgi:hypothetical protein
MEARLSEGVQKIGGRLRQKGQITTINGVNQAQCSGVQGLSLKSQLRSAPIHRIGHQGMAQPSHVNPNLVGTPSV